jgi:hypothetical protein
MMTSQKGKPTVRTSEKLLSAQELALCKKIAGKETPYKLRAAMLLAMHANNTQAQASEATGMSTGQVKYWMARFRKERMAIFPEGVKGTGVTKATAPAKPVPVEAVKAKEPAEVLESKTDKQGGKGGKKSKKGKKGKKARKGKKGKKGKKKSGKGKKK